MSATQFKAMPHTVRAEGAKSQRNGLHDDNPGRDLFVVPMSIEGFIPKVSLCVRISPSSLVSLCSFVDHVY